MIVMMIIVVRIMKRIFQLYYIYQVHMFINILMEHVIYLQLYMYNYNRVNN